MWNFEHRCVTCIVTFIQVSMTYTTIDQTLMNPRYKMDQSTNFQMEEFSEQPCSFNYSVIIRYSAALNKMKTFALLTAIISPKNPSLGHHPTLYHLYLSYMFMVYVNQIKDWKSSQTTCTVPVAGKNGILNFIKHRRKIQL